MHPLKKAFEGKDMSGYTDKNGKHIYRAFARVGREDQAGYVDYQF